MSLGTIDNNFVNEDTEDFLKTEHDIKDLESFNPLDKNESP